MTDTKNRRRRTFRPMLECLEDRCTPATFTVNDDRSDAVMTGAGTGTLRWCIDQAKKHADASNAIVFDAATMAGKTIALDEALPYLTSKITSITGLLNAAKQPTVTIRRDAAADTDFPIFGTNEFAAPTISGLTMRDGTGDRLRGGGIYNEGDLTLTDCVLVNNKVVGGAREDAMGGRDLQRCRWHPGPQRRDTQG